MPNGDESLCCLPGRLAYFESEDTRFILERTK